VDCNIHFIDYPRVHDVSEDHASSGMKVCALIVLDSPASLLQRLVNVCAGFIFGGRQGVQNTCFRSFNHPRFYWQTWLEAYGERGMAV
jgi:hypothetical protein